MTCVQEQDFTPASGLCGRAFQLTAGDAEFSVFFALPEANASFLSTAPYVILPYAAMLALVHGEVRWKRWCALIPDFECPRS